MPIFSQICWKIAGPDVPTEIDHIIPWSIVKEHKLDNLRVLCRDHNRGKSNKTGGL